MLLLREKRGVADAGHLAIDDAVVTLDLRAHGRRERGAFGEDGFDERRVALEPRLARAERFINGAIQQRRCRVRRGEIRKSRREFFTRHQINAQQRLRKKPFVAAPFFRIGVGIAAGRERIFRRRREAGDPRRRGRFRPIGAGDGLQPTKPRRIGWRGARHIKVVKSARVAAGKTKHHAPSPQSGVERGAEFGNGEDFLRVGAPAGLGAAAGALHLPECDRALADFAARKFAVITDEERQRPTLRHARQNLALQGPENLGLRRGPVFGEFAG